MNTSFRPDRLLLAAAIAVCLLSLPAVSAAQGGWNRRIEAVAVTADSANPALSDVHVVFEVHHDGTQSTPLDLGTVVELYLDGTLAASHTVPVGIDPGAGGCVDAAACGGSCGSGHVDGQAMTLLCLADGACSPLCDCKCMVPPITWTFPGNPVQTGDEIMVLLRPAPGALPDGDTSDDQMLQTFDGDPVSWDRRIDQLDVTESAAGGGLYDVTVEGTVFHEGLAKFLPSGATADLSLELDLLVNGALVSTTPIDFQPLPLVTVCTCGNACGSYNGLVHVCIPYAAGTCHCGWPWLSTVPAVPLTVGDEIMVILRPAPGALPELPGLDEDDDRRDVCCRGATGVETIAAGTTTLLRQNRPNPFRASTTIAFSVAATAPVSLDVFDLQGRRVRTLVDGEIFDAGTRHSVTWDGVTRGGDRAPAGIYFCRLATGGHTATRKMTLTK